MLKRLLHRLMEQPIIYDLIQKLVGSSIIYKNLHQLASALPNPNSIVDIGGGTGVYRDIWKNTKLYICLDNDDKKLAGFNNKFSSHGVLLLADATKIPLKYQSVDLIQSTMMSHHLNEDQLVAMINESHRVLKNDGVFFFADALWLAKSLRGRFLWSVDRGSYPKNQQTLFSIIEKKFKIINHRIIKIHHTYLFLIGRKL